MVLATPVGSLAEAALLGNDSLADVALADAALAFDPVGADALALEAVATPSALPVGSVFDEETMVADLIELARTEDPVAAYLGYLGEHATEAPAYVWFLRAAYRAQLQNGLAECPTDAEAGALLAGQLAATFGPFFVSLSLEVLGAAAPGTSLHTLVASNPGVVANSSALVSGLVAGFVDSGVVSAENLQQLIEANVALAVVSPVHAACFIAGTIYQLVMDVYGIAGAIVAAVGYVDEIVTLACRLLAALPVALGRLLDAESADAVALVGRQLGQVLAASLEKHVPQLHDAASWLDVARELVEFSFLCGTVFGPLLLDIILSVAGIGFVTAAVKLLGNTINIAADVIASMFDLIRRLLDVVDPGLCDDVIAFGTKLAGRLDVRLEELAARAAAEHGFNKESIQSGLAVLERALGGERYRAYTSGMFCRLDP